MVFKKPVGLSGHFRVLVGDIPFHCDIVSGVDDVGMVLLWTPRSRCRSSSECRQSSILVLLQSYGAVSNIVGGGSRSGGQPPPNI